ncbi:Crp/Fnr family transcriptional regulator [Sedimentibacter sp. MB31-C6]|uniref:Crp/Fnr family transcriptional regulator n=1 Tax=Sedimentibacter sp. MB31-C6 TaxID=3109366 RepID=UPI002DDD36E3|nr:Crp/Fnr family transcriptional regulator [Sedimentibacter sp. MB36-C1]WSI03373.1 Crp/Fnr family transcriptional regulator [Sedimentibacter sp. MB36-C1]
MSNTINIIKDNILFDGIKEEEIEKILLCGNGIVKKFDNNQIIFERQDIINNIGIVLEGEFNLVTQKYNGTRVIITTLELNDLFGEALIFSSTKEAPYDLVSSGESKALFLPYSIFTGMCSEVCNFHRKLISNMLSILSDKIIMLNNKMTILNAETLKERIAIYLISIYKKTKKLTFDIPMKRQELAEFLNVTRPSLSREISKMQKDKIIEINRSKVIIISLEKLYELAE